MKIIFAQILAFVSVTHPLFGGTLLRNNFESADWPTRSVVTTGGATATGIYGAYGTIDAQTDVTNNGVDVASKGLLFTVNSSAAGGAWKAELSSGVLTLTTANTNVTNLGLITLCFSLRASKAHPIIIRLESYDAVGANRTGGLKRFIYPAAPNYYQRFALDLSTFAQDGTGTFVPIATKIVVSFELDSTAGGDGWPAASDLTLKIDNLHYATPRWYVAPSPTGNDNTGNGSAAAPYATANKALSQATPGDIVVLRGGTYLSSISFKNVAGTSCLAGAPDAWISLKNYPGETPIIRNKTWGTISIGLGTSTTPNTGPAAAYLEIRGLNTFGYSTVDANGDRNLDPTVATPTLLSKLGKSFGETNCNGISADCRNMTNIGHDIRIADCIVEYHSGGGISMHRVDRLMIENNISRYNCWWTVYGTSGFSSLVPADYENNNDYRMVFQGNQAYGNETLAPCSASDTKFSDGNGIIIDVNRNIEVSGKDNNPYPAYRAKTLVQNNLVYNNGGSGIHAFNAQNVDIIHNTAWLNSSSARLLYGQIYAGYSKNVRMIGNILVAPSNPTGDSAWNESYTANGSQNTSGTIFYQNNLYYGLGNNLTVPSGHTQTPSANFTPNTVANPQLLAPSGTSTLPGNFQLRSASPARNAAPVIPYRSALDLNRNSRPIALIAADLGAYQTQANTAFAPLFTPVPGNFNANQTVVLTCDTTGAKIVYTINGSTPTVDVAGNITNGTEYITAITVSTKTTIKAIAWKTALATSDVSGGEYSFDNLSALPISDLIFFPDQGSYAGTQLVGLMCRTPGAIIRYTTDGSTPSTTNGTIISAPMLSISRYTNLKAIAYLPGRANSAVKSANYTITGTLGNVSAGTVLEPLGTNKIRYSKFTAANSNTLANVFAHISGAGIYRVALYSDNAGVPDALLATSNALTNPTAGWNTSTFTSTYATTAGTVYWLAIWSDNTAAQIYSDTTGGTVREAVNNTPWPSSAGTTTASTNGAYNLALYATPLNLAPNVAIPNSNLSVILPNSLGISGIVTDDALPKFPGNSSLTWSKISGPGTITFANANAAATTASFSDPGDYVIRLTATDGALQSIANINVTVTYPVGFVPHVGSLSSGTTIIPVPASNARFARVQAIAGFTAANIYARIVSAGASSVYRAALYADASGVPGALLSRSSTRLADAPTGWNKFVIETPQVISSGSFYWLAIWCNSTSGGVYADTTGGTLRELVGNNLGGNGTWPNPVTTTTSTTPNYTLSIYAAPAATNLAPVISAGEDETISLPATAPLGGSVTDDGQPLAPGVPAIVWSKISGPGTVIFTNPSDDSTTASFSLPGTYILRLSANDGELSGTPDNITVTVNDSYTAWAGRNGMGAPLEDTNKNGLLNLLEYATNTSNLPQSSTDSETGNLAFTFNRIADPVLTYEVEASAELQTWEMIWTSNGAQNILGPVTVTDSPLSESPARFLRLKVTLP